MRIITLSYQIDDVIPVNIYKDSILTQVVTKFDRLKIDSGADAVMFSDYKHFAPELITAFQLLSILRLPTLVTTCFSIQSFQILA